MQTHPSVLVIGGAGAIGSNLVRRLIADGYKTTVFNIDRNDLVRLEDLKGSFELIVGDVTELGLIETVIKKVKPEIVYNLASTVWARVPIPQSEHLKVNGIGTLNVLEALKGTKARFVFTSSAAVYGPGHGLREDSPIVPNTVFGACKATASLFLQTYARIYGLSTVELRFFMPYGPWEHPQRMIPQVILAGFEKRDLPMSAGVQTRDPVYIDDVVEALVLAGTKQVKPGSIYNIGAGVAVPIKEVVTEIFDLMGNPAQARFGELPTRPDEIMEMSADISAAERELGWKPQVSLREGLQKTIEWWKRNQEFGRRITADR